MSHPSPQSLAVRAVISGSTKIGNLVGQEGGLPPLTFATSTVCFMKQSSAVLLPDDIHSQDSLESLRV